jgi:hypothetical protein
MSARGSAAASRYAARAPATSVGVAVRIGMPPGNGRGGPVSGKK